MRPDQTSPNKHPAPSRRNSSYIARITMHTPAGRSPAHEPIEHVTQRLDRTAKAADLPYHCCQELCVRNTTSGPTLLELATERILQRAQRQLGVSMWWSWGEEDKGGAEVVDCVWLCRWWWRCVCVIAGRWRWDFAVVGLWDGGGGAGL